MVELNTLLSRWVGASLLDEATAERIRAFEAERSPEHALRWPIILAIAFGSLMVGGGVLLFVAAHWEQLSPPLRFLAVLALVGGFHLLGAWFAERMSNLAVALHGVGTLALGAGIFLAGQIFNLQEHWPGGVLLWALGASLGFWLLRDWAQGTLAALLIPFWLMGEWDVATRHGWSMADGAERILAMACFLLATSYLTARQSDADSTLRKALGWIGGLGFLPAVIAVMSTTQRSGWWGDGSLEPRLAIVGWGVALVGPLGLALILRGRKVWLNLAAAGWALILGGMAEWQWQIYVWCALGAVGLVFWGLREARRERVNLGIAGFAITLLAFYFSSVLDKLGRSLGLIGLGLLFLLGGWQLERLRRLLNARIARGGGR